MNKIEELREKIRKYCCSGDTKEDYRVILARNARLFELDKQLNLLENLTQSPNDSQKLLEIEAEIEELIRIV